ncbi:putative oxidase/peroxidase, partial [Operophtera brumata]
LLDHTNARFTLFQSSDPVQYWIAYWKSVNRHWNELKPDCGEGPCDYVRSAPVRNRDSCEVREQMNLATSFLDGSALYGSSEKELRSLRLYDAGKIDVHSATEVVE